MCHKNKSISGVEGAFVHVLEKFPFRGYTDDKKPYMLLAVQQFVKQGAANHQAVLSAISEVDA